MEEEQRAGGGSEAAVAGTAQRTSVGELVRQLNDAPGQPADGRDKRGRSESGDALPAGKRGGCLRVESGRSPKSGPETVRERVEVMMQDFENRILSGISKDLHELRDIIQSQLDAYEARIKDLERHAEEMVNDVEVLKKDLHNAREEIVRLHSRSEDAEINSRLPCLILSGSSLAPHPASGRPVPAPGSAPAAAGARQSAPSDGSRTPGGEGRTVAGGDGRTAAGGGAAGRESAERTPVPAARADERGGQGGVRGEDVNQLVITTLNRCLPGLDMRETDIDRAHRLPGAGNRIIVRFVRSGRGSVRDEVYWRRLSLKGKELFVSESLTKLRGRIFRSLLSAKKQSKVHTVFTRGGQVFCKLREHGVAERVDSLQKVEQLGFPIVQ